MREAEGVKVGGAGSGVIEIAVDPIGFVLFAVAELQIRSEVKRKFCAGVGPKLGVQERFAEGVFAIAIEACDGCAIEGIRSDEDGGERVWGWKCGGAELVFHIQLPGDAWFPWRGNVIGRISSGLVFVDLSAGFVVPEAGVGFIVGVDEVAVVAGAEGFAGRDVDPEICDLAGVVSGDGSSLRRRVGWQRRGKLQAEKRMRRMRTGAGGYGDKCGRDKEEGGDGQRDFCGVQ